MNTNLEETAAADTTQVDLASASRFDPSKFRLSQNFGATAGVKKLITTIPVRKPGRADFFRVHPNSSHHLETMVLEDKSDNETYLVDPALWDALAGEIVPKVLVTTINRHNDISLWPIRLPGEDGRHDRWNSSALQASDIAKAKWIRLASNMHIGAYDIYEATGNIADPIWPELNMDKILDVAFKDRFIQDMNHPVLRRLRGEI